MGEEGKTFDEWFAAEGFADEHRAVLAQAWNAALDNAKLNLDYEWGWVLDKLRA